MCIFSKKLAVLGFSLVLTLGALCYQVRAHPLWLTISDYTPEMGETVRLTLGYGHFFPARKFMPQEYLDKIYMIDPNGKELEIKPISEVEFQVEKPLRESGTYLAIAKKKGGFFTRTTEGYKRQSKKGLKNVVRCFWSEMYAKAIVNVGEGSRSPFKVIGHPLEILPLKDPADLKEGDYLPVKVLFKDEPLDWTPVHATYAGFSAKKEVFAYTTRTNKKGIAEIKILKSGIWLIKVDHKVPYPNPEECDEYYYCATLTFEVK